MSVGPPGGKGTMKRTGLAGYCCAAAGMATNDAANSAASTNFAARYMRSPPRDFAANGTISKPARRSLQKAFEDFVGIEVERRPRGERIEILFRAHGAEITPVIEHVQVGVLAARLAHADAALERPRRELQFAQRLHQPQIVLRARFLAGAHAAAALDLVREARAAAFLEPAFDVAQLERLRELAQRVERARLERNTP